MSRFARIACLAVSVGAALVLAGWALEVAWLANAVGGVTMKWNTAVLFLAVAAALALRPSTKPLPKRVSSALLFGVLSFSALTLTQYLTGVDLGIDQLLFEERLETAGSLSPGRMAPNTAVAFGALALSALMPRRAKSKDHVGLEQWLAGVVIVIALIAIIDRIFSGANQTASYRQMALLTAVYLLVLGGGLFALRPDEGVMKRLRGDALGARLGRMLLPAALVVPFIVGLLRLEGERAGLYDREYGVTLFIVATALLFTAAVLTAARFISQQDRERRLYVAQLRSVQAEVSQANRFLDAVFEHLPTVIFVKDAKTLAYTLVNRKTEELLGIPRSQLIGHVDTELFPGPEAASYQQKDRKTLDEGTLVDIPEEPLPTKDGVRWLHTKKVPIFGEDGRPEFLLGISEDITDQRRAQQELRRAKDRAEATSKELEAFSYSVSHDLRSPLRSIDGFSQALLDDCYTQLGPEGQDYLRRIRGAAQRMGELIDDLLHLARVTRAELRMQRISVSNIARQVARELSSRSPERKVNFDIKEGLEAQADPGLLRAVLENLLGNAFKFTSKRADATVRVGDAGEKDGLSVFVVADNGAGFDQTYVGKLFGAFQRLHAMSEFEGTGIGLATVQRIIHRHGGSVWAEGRVGEGASFYFSLPKVIGEAAA